MGMVEKSSIIQLLEVGLCRCAVEKNSGLFVGHSERVSHLISYRTAGLAVTDAKIGRDRTFSE